MGVSQEVAMLLHKSLQALLVPLILDLYIMEMVNFLQIIMMGPMQHMYVNILVLAKLMIYQQLLHLASIFHPIESQYILNAIQIVQVHQHYKHNIR